mmetsp:Transcript_7341/g.16691  ORF Transcript_7341/g.16691 Transcript_7341/m.16691 type:complete len:437 (-) Transcript_7341:985-2295(-)|eukprot:CAMPEP_0116838070 /NCGR_PEP_ID=MMETSP0418-20121206/9005_1 /TAXON_ID=1158023 /ORGANISM="Astrosyne radiata, Strain 13vi08-1A" /LENGTH=436 /DNA_ID=CAMNT_0004468025 /DNA_START=202 /DNA_END=1512 /DNA_ORIENTATION=-
MTTRKHRIGLKWSPSAVRILVVLVAIVILLVMLFSESSSTLQVVLQTTKMETETQAKKKPLLPHPGKARTNDNSITKKDKEANKKRGLGIRDDSFWHHHDTKLHAIFFNIYLGGSSSGELSPRIHRNLKEQLGQIKSSNVSRRSILYYNTIGGMEANRSSFACPTAQCVHLDHYERGWEDVTLTQLRDYCRVHPNRTVSYLHNKGSFHANLGNQIIRRIATRSALSDACVTMKIMPNETGNDDDGRQSCNTCGLTFQQVPHLHYSANFWTSNCLYVRQLWYPTPYKRHRDAMCSRFQNQTNVIPCTDDEIANGGLGRNAMEHWVVSGPGLRPCHVFTKPFTLFETGFESLLQPTLSVPNKLKSKPAKGAHQVATRHVQQVYYLYGNQKDFKVINSTGICISLYSRIRKEYNPCMRNFQITPVPPSEHKLEFNETCQ